MKKANVIDQKGVTSAKAAAQQVQVRTVARPKATAAQESKVTAIRTWEDRSERMLLAGDRVRL